MTKAARQAGTPGARSRDGGLSRLVDRSSWPLAPARRRCRPLVAGPPGQRRARAAAVLILFGEGPDGPDLLLLQRADTLRKHAGQPAFPGGGIDPGDDGPVGAARCARPPEETGLDPSGVEVLATMPEMYVSRSGYRVTPVVGWWRTPSAGRGRTTRARSPPSRACRWRS